jgi:glycosyltransferase 2 family protein
VKKAFNIFIYVSLIFLVYALYKADYLVVPKIYNYSHLSIAIILCCAGFISDAFAWKKALHSYNYNKASFNDAVSGMGLSIFGKYIPGKIWVIAGRAAYISNKYDYSFKNISAISFNAQFIVLWTGLLVGAIGIFSYGNINYWGELVLLFWIGLSLIIFVKWFQDILVKMFSFVFRKKIELPQISASKNLSLIPYYFLPWLFWCAGFFFLAESLTYESVNPLIGVGFALGATFGVFAVIVPGGIGVREGVLTGFLVLTGISLEIAVTVSLASRFWYLFGELFIFLYSMIIKLNRKKIS